MILTKALMLQGIGGLAIAVVVVLCTHQLFLLFADEVARKVVKKWNAQRPIEAQRKKAA